MIYRIEKTTSTNDDAREAKYVHGDVIWAEQQTAGRGQRGHKWDSATGDNLTFSTVLAPTFLPVDEQFLLSEAVALALCDTFEAFGIAARIKWTNDIYVGNHKLSGMLFEHSFSGPTLSRSVVGIGINVNQTRFVGDAPNPVSMAMLNGETYSLEDMAGNLAAALESRLAMLGDRERLHEEFMERLWRGDGIAYPFADRRAGERIKASIEAVDPDGMLTLCLDGGETRRYAFKEVEFLLDGADSILK